MPRKLTLQNMSPAQRAEWRTIAELAAKDAVGIYKHGYSLEDQAQGIFSYVNSDGVRVYRDSELLRQVHAENELRQQEYEAARKAWRLQGWQKAVDAVLKSRADELTQLDLAHLDPSVQVAALRAHADWRGEKGQRFQVPSLSDAIDQYLAESAKFGEQPPTAAEQMQIDYAQVFQQNALLASEALAGPEPDAPELIPVPGAGEGMEVMGAVRRAEENAEAARIEAEAAAETQAQADAAPQPKPPGFGMIPPSDPNHVSTSIDLQPPTTAAVHAMFEAEAARVEAEARKGDVTKVSRVEDKAISNPSNEAISSEGPEAA